MGEVIESSQPKKHMICLMINGEDELSLCFNRRGRRGYVASERRQTVLNSSPVSTTEFSDVKGLALIQQMVAHPVGAVDYLYSQMGREWLHYSLTKSPVFRGTASASLRL